MIKDNGVMCTFPFIQFSTTVEGKYQTCCIAKPDDKMTIENTSPMEFFNSSKSKQLRHCKNLNLKLSPSDIKKDFYYKEVEIY